MLALDRQYVNMMQDKTSTETSACLRDHCRARKLRVAISRGQKSSKRTYKKREHTICCSITREVRLNKFSLLSLNYLHFS